MSHLYEVADACAIAHGKQYIGAVTGLQETADGVSATVHGTEPYQVALYLYAGRLTGECDCPRGIEGDFCRHCVAVGMLYVEIHGPATEHAPTAVIGGPEHDLRARLESLDHGELVEILLAAAKEDAALYHRLAHGDVGWLPAPGAPNAAPDASSMPDVLVMRRQIEQVLHVRSLVDYRGGIEYARKVADIVAALRVLEGQGHHPEVLELSCLVVQTIAVAVREIDDTSGAVAAEADAVAGLHAAACAASPPDPVVLADWLLAFQLARHQTPRLDIDDYRSALGTEGMAAYTTALRARWDRERRGRLGVRFWTVAHLMERLAVVEGDTDALIQVLSADLSTGARYLRIASALEHAGRRDEALGWAERGIRAAQGPFDEGLADFVAARYAADGRRADVLALRRGAFERRYAVATYAALRSAALAIDDGARAWAEARAWALERVRSEARVSPRWKWSRAGHPPLIDILLWEADHDSDAPADEEAWQAAHDLGATTAHWVALADRRAATHPEDALAVYRRTVDALVAQKRNEDYVWAAELVQRTGDLYEHLARPDEATAYVEHLRTRYRARRNFMAELTRRGL